MISDVRYRFQELGYQPYGSEVAEATKLARILSPRTSRSTVPTKIALTNKCLVLDLDETLVHTVVDYIPPETLSTINSDNDIASRIYSLDIVDIMGTSDGVISNICGTVRPGVESFLKFAQNYFQVVTVWSAGTPKYVDAITRHLFRNLNSPIKIYNRNHCEDNGEYLYKPLDKMFNDNFHGGLMRPENTLILDDRDTTFSYNTGNGILIPPYEPECQIECIKQHDDVLGRFMHWLMLPDVLGCNDMRYLRKDDMFLPELMAYKNYLERNAYNNMRWLGSHC